MKGANMVQSGFRERIAFDNLKKKRTLKIE